MRFPARRHRWSLAVAALLVAACGAPQLTQTTTPLSSGSSPPVASASLPVARGAVEPAPGSHSTLYAPDPAAITVAIDAGHGGCLDWGVPNPFANSVANAEKTVVLGIALALRDRLEADGVRVVMTRDGDEAIAGDEAPQLGCAGPAFRDVNGDGVAGFGPELPEGTLARDELQSRIDLANVVRADLLLSIHINSFVDDAGAPIEIAATQTFYTDETTWGASASAQLAADVQAGVVTGLDTPYDRQDRGTQAKNFYIVAPPLFEPSADRPDPVKQPARGALMPAVLSEVGSMALEAEATYLTTPAGQAAVADGLAAGIGSWLAHRPLAVSWDAGDVPPRAPVDGRGPPFWAPVSNGDGAAVRLTNDGNEAWPDDLRLVAGSMRSDAPYLRAAPELTALDLAVPALAPGESTTVQVPLPSAAGRTVTWVDLEGRAGRFGDRGSPPLQLASGAPESRSP